MPNWCDNILDVNFTTKEAYLACLAAIELNENNTQCEDHSFSIMAYFRPYPLKEYDRAVMSEIYGVKWFESDLNVETCEGLLSMRFTFMTPWGAPVDLYDFMTENAEELGVTYFKAGGCEIGMDFMCKFNPVDGYESAGLSEYTESYTNFDSHYAEQLVAYEDGELSEDDQTELLYDYPDFADEDAYSYPDQFYDEALTHFTGMPWVTGYGG